MRRPRPTIAFERLRPGVRAPQPFINSESITLYASDRIYADIPFQVVNTRVAITLDPNYQALIQSHPFAAQKGLFITPMYPIDSLHGGPQDHSGICINVFNFLVRKQEKSRIILVDDGQPLALLTLVRSSWFVVEYKGWEPDSIPEQSFG